MYLDTNTFRTNFQHVKNQLIMKYSSTLGKRAFEMILQSLNVATRKEIQKCIDEESLMDLFSVNNERRYIVFSYNLKSCWNERSDHVTIINQLLGINYEGDKKNEAEVQFHFKGTERDLAWTYIFEDWDNYMMDVCNKAITIDNAIQQAYKLAYSSKHVQAALMMMRKYSTLDEDIAASISWTMRTKEQNLIMFIEALVSSKNKYIQPIYITEGERFEFKDMVDQWKRVNVDGHLSEQVRCTITYGKLVIILHLNYCKKKGCTINMMFEYLNNHSNRCINDKIIEVHLNKYLGLAILAYEKNQEEKCHECHMGRFGKDLFVIHTQHCENPYCIIPTVVVKWFHHAKRNCRTRIIEPLWMQSLMFYRENVNTQISDLIARRVDNYDNAEFLIYQGDQIGGQTFRSNVEFAGNIVK